MFRHAQSHATSTPFDRRDPSPALIRRRAAAIRKHWSPRTRLKRAGLAEGFLAIIEMAATPNRRGYDVDA